MSYSVVKYSVIEGRQRQFLSLVTSLWKVLITNENHSLYMLYLWTAEKWRWTKVKVWANVHSLQAPDSWWCDLLMSSGSEAKRVLEKQTVVQAGVCALSRSTLQANAETMQEIMQLSFWCVANAVSAALCMQVLMQTEVEGWKMQQK